MIATEKINNENICKLGLVGRVVGTEKKPNTTLSFNFWTNIESKVGIGTIVRVESDKIYLDKENKQYRRTVFGIVTEGISYTDLEAPIHDFISCDGKPNPEFNPQTERQEIRYFTALVLRSDPEEPIQPVSIGNVYLADEKDVEFSLRMDKFEKTRIPIGLYDNGDKKSPVYVDSEFLLGPEAAHLNVTGVSGLATKTSIVEFLLSSIFKNYNDEKIAAVLFNVKGTDLLYLDQVSEKLIPGTEEFDENSYEMYKQLGFDNLKAFEDIEYYSPFLSDGYNLKTLRPDELGKINFLRWGLLDIFDNIEVILNKDDLDAKADGFLKFLQEKIIDKDKTNPDYSVTKRIKCFKDLVEWFDNVFDNIKNNDDRDGGQWKGHSIHTIRKVYNRLTNIINRCEGLVVNDNDTQDLPWGNFEDKHIYVVDIADMLPLAQDLVVTRIIEKLRTVLESNNLGVKKVVVFVDELNKYASSDSGSSYIKQTLLDISERGRYLNLVLFSAQQFKSQVHSRIVGNCGTSIYGRMDMEELAKPEYSIMPQSIKAELAVLDKGKFLIRHPHFNQYIFVKFPRPIAMPSQEGREKFGTSEIKLTFEEAMIRNFKSVDPKLKGNVIKEAINVRNAKDEINEEEVLRAFNIASLQYKINNDDFIKLFKSKLYVKPETVNYSDIVSKSTNHITNDEIDNPYNMF